MMMERSSSFNQEAAEEICNRIAEGQMLTKICAEEHLPDRLSFYRWMTSRDDLANAYARARLMWSDWWAEKAVILSLDGSGDIYLDEGGKPVVDHANIQRARLQVDTIKWLVGKYAPRTYGEKPVELPTEPAQVVSRIERVIIEGVAPRVGPDDDPDADYPRQITCRQPEPGDLSADQWSSLRSLLDLIQRTVGVRDPDEVFSVLKTALLEHFRDEAET